jgi:penicillin-binding protein 1A
MNLRRTGLYLLSLMLTVTILGLVTALIVYVRIEPQLPSIGMLSDVRLQEPLRVYSRDHRLIAEFGEKRRTPVRIDDVPPLMVHAFLAAEDDHFYEHSGVDIPGLIHAAIDLARTGRKRRGASTITMQVARNFFLTREKTYLRKITEILLAFRIEHSLSKNQILELYFNKIFLGHRAYGIQAAAQVYYGKGISELSLAETAMIAGLPKAPSRVNPVTDPEDARNRRDYVLDRMLELGYIDQAAHDEAVAEPVRTEVHTVPTEVDAPFVAEMVRSDMVDRYDQDAYTSGLEVTTTIDSRDQQAANAALRKDLLDYSKRHGYRGPEAHVDLAATPPEARTSLLDSYAAVGGLEPALVTAVAERQATVLRKDGSEQVLDWDALSWARPYRTVNVQGPAPKQAGDVLHPGDIVRLQMTDAGKAELSQLPGVEGALVSLAPDDGAILALVGGFDFRQSKFNRVTQARRQPGSSFKPIIYSAALEKGFTPATMINDAPVVFDDPKLESTWRPENYSGRFFGPTRLREALYRSRNLVSIRVLRAIGASYAVQYAERFGFSADELPHDLTLALGSASVTPLQMVRAYAVLANGGFLIDPYFIREIRDANGNVLFTANPPVACRECPETPAPDSGANATPAVPVAAATTITPVTAPAQGDSAAGAGTVAPATAAVQDATPGAGGGVQPQPEPVYAPRTVSARNVWLMTSMMRDVIQRGTGVRARVLGRSDLAGKTGTTNDQMDGWFSGFNHAVVTTAWTGFDKLEPLGRGETGGNAALPMWIDYMRVALKGVPEIKQTPPDGLVTVRIDPATGLLARSGQRDAIFETFMEENVPQQSVETGAGPGRAAATDQLF